MNPPTLKITKNKFIKLLKKEKGVRFFKKLLQTVFADNLIFWVVPAGDKVYIEMSVESELDMPTNCKVFWLHNWSLLEQNIRRWIHECSLDWEEEENILLTERVIEYISEDTHGYCGYDAVPKVYRKDDDLSVEIKLYLTTDEEEQIGTYKINEEEQIGGSIDFVLPGCEKSKEDMINVIKNFMENTRKTQDLKEEVCMRIHYNPRLERTKTEQEEYHKQFIKTL